MFPHGNKLPTMLLLLYFLWQGVSGLSRIIVWCQWLQGSGGRPKRSAHTVQLFGRLAVLETHALRY